MAVRSYLSDRAGGEVAAGAFATPEAAAEAIRMLRDSGIRWQEISVLARDEAIAARLAKEAGAWAPMRRFLPFGPALPKTVRSRYARPLAQGAIILVVAEDGQKTETLAAILERAKAADVHIWWQEPANIFPPPELGGR